MRVRYSQTNVKKKRKRAVSRFARAETRLEPRRNFLQKMFFWKDLRVRDRSIDRPAFVNGDHRRRCQTSDVVPTDESGMAGGPRAAAHEYTWRSGGLRSSGRGRGGPSSSIRWACYPPFSRVCKQTEEMKVSRIVGGNTDRDRDNGNDNDNDIACSAFDHVPKTK